MKPHKTKKYSISAAVTKHLHEADVLVRDYLMGQEFMQHVETVSATQPVPSSVENNSTEPRERVEFKAKIVQKRVVLGEIFDYFHSIQTGTSTVKPDYFPERLHELQSLRFGLWKPLDTKITNDEIMTQTGINLLIAHLEDGERHWVVHKKSDGIALMSVPHHSSVLPSSTPLSHLKPKNSKRPSRKPYQTCLERLWKILEAELYKAATTWFHQDQSAQQIANAQPVKHPAPVVRAPTMEGKTIVLDSAEKENAQNTVDTNLTQITSTAPSSTDDGKNQSNTTPLKRPAPSTQTEPTNAAKADQINLVEGANTIDQQVASASVNTVPHLLPKDKDVEQISYPSKRRSPSTETNANVADTDGWNPESKRIRRGSE